MKKIVTIIAILFFTLITSHSDEKCYPKKYDGEFHKAIKNADRIVVREGGYYYQFNDDGSPIQYETYFVIIDPKEIKEVYNNLKFTNMDQATCDCTGEPGIDWYKGGAKIAMTSSKHCGCVVWKDEIENFLTKNSSKWLKSWFLKHSLKKEHIE